VAKIQNCVKSEQQEIWICRRGELALKIDISKAYDKVDWGFLIGVLSRMRFCGRWIGLDDDVCEVC
jgi:hypothetical protein